MAQQTILEGSTFCICDELGDVGEKTHGLFVDDTRFLSRLKLTLDGRRPLLLSSGAVEYYSAAFFLRNPLTKNLPLDAVSIKRERFVGDGMQDHVALTNVTTQELAIRVGIELGSDFADIISVKAWDFALGDPRHAKPLPNPVPPRFEDAQNRFVLVDPDGYGRTQIVLSQQGRVDGSAIEFDVILPPRETWNLRIDVAPTPKGAQVTAPHVVERHFGEERERVRESLEAWQVSVPQIRAEWDDLRQTFSRSVNDLAALRMRAGDAGHGRLPAAGMPWFMTIFGRDTLITCLQTMLFGPELARGALRELAALQAASDDPSRDAAAAMYDKYRGGGVPTTAEYKTFQDYIFRHIVVEAGRLEPGAAGQAPVAGVGGAARAACEGVTHGAILLGTPYSVLSTDQAPTP